MSSINNIKGLLQLMIILVALAAFNACSLTPNSNFSSRPDTVSANKLSISGKIVSEDGVTPIQNALVYIADANETIEFKKSSLCGYETIPETGKVCTNIFGEFSMPLDHIQQFPVDVRIVKDKIATNISIELEDINSHIGTVVLLSDELAHIKDKVAIVLDFYNPYQEILKKLENNEPFAQSVRLQLINQYRDMYDIDTIDNDITYPTFYSLFIDADKNGKADIYDYDVVYINSRSEEDLALLDKSMRNTLVEYLTFGGILYVTEWTIEVVEPGLDQYI